MGSVFFCNGSVVQRAEKLVHKPLQSDANSIETGAYRKEKSAYQS